MNDLRRRGYAWVIWPGETNWLRVPAEEFDASDFQPRSASWRDARYVFVSDEDDAARWMRFAGIGDSVLVQATLLSIPSDAVEVPAPDEPGDH